MSRRLLVTLALAATTALVITGVALAAFGLPEIADPMKWTGDNDAIAPDRQLAADAHGNVLWLSYDSPPHEPMVLYERCGASGSAWPVDQRLGADGSVPVGIATTPANRSLVVSYVDDGATRTFSSQQRDETAGGTAIFGAVQTIVATEQTTLRFALAADGDAVAAWVAGGRAHASLRPDGGTWGADQTLDESAQSVRVAMDADGDAVALVYGGGQERAYFRPAGGTWGGAETVENLGFAVLPQSQQVEFDGAGRPVALYAQQGRLHASIRSAAGWQATATELDDTSGIGVVPLARHPDGLVAAWLRRLSPSNDSLQLAVARLKGSTWEPEKVYTGDDHWFGTSTVSVNDAGEILLAAGRFAGDFGEQEEIWGTRLASIDAAWPADLERLSPASDATHRYRDPVSAASGDTFLVGFAVHGTSDAYSQVIATDPPGPCPGAQPTPTATPSATPEPLPPQPTPTPQPQPQPQPKPPKLAKFVALPPAKGCVRRLALQVKTPPSGFGVTGVKVRVNGRPAKVARKGATIRLRRLPKGRFTVEVRVKLDGGQVVKGSRRYRRCR